LRGWSEVHECPAFLGHFLARFVAGFGLLVERLRDRRGPAEVAESEDVNLEFSAFGTDLQAVSNVDVAAGFDRLVGALNSVEFAGVGGLGAGLEEARGP